MIELVHWLGRIAGRRLTMTRLSAALLLASSATSGAMNAQQRPVGRDSLVADSTARDSLLDRLQRAEAAIETLRRQLAIEATTVVRTRSRLQIELSARVLTNAFRTTRRVNSVDVPQFVLPEAAVPPPPAGGVSPGSPGTRAMGISLRQTRIGAALSVDSVLGGTFEGDLEMDFFGGVSAGPGDRRLFPEPRLRTARAHIRWDRGAIFVGSETPLISDLNPISLATVGIPGFVAAGNLWNWLPQIRVSRDLLVHPSGFRVGVQGAVIAPFSASQHIAETDAVDASERSGRPYLQGRANVRWGAGGAVSGAPSDVMLGESGGELGVGIHRGWLRSSGDSLSVSRAFSLDGRIALGTLVELRGEAYRGQLIRGLGGGAIGQTFGRGVAGAVLGAPVRAVAGWAQLNVQAHPTLIAGAGCGRDAVNTEDQPIRLTNTSCATHALWRPAQPIVIGLEFRRLQTQYSDRTSRANHLNLSFGFEL